jgi:hypothetical protein
MQHVVGDVLPAELVPAELDFYHVDPAGVNITHCRTDVSA